MSMPSAIIRFTESAEEELSILAKEMRLSKLVENLTPQSQIPEDLKDDLRHLLVTLSDLFSTSLPPLEDSPLETLRLASRDINLSRVLRERGLMRVYRLLNEKVEVVEADPFTSTPMKALVPLFMTQANPDDGTKFLRREDFIGWFCAEAKVPRSLVFMRMATIDKLLTLGFTLDDAYSTILMKPSAIRDTLNLVGTWDKGELVDVRPEVATRLAERMLPDQVEQVQQLVDVVTNENADEEEQEEARQRLNETLKPAVTQLVKEVASHPNAKDAMDFVRHDIVGKPEIAYRWDYDSNTLEVTMVRKSIDPKGTEYISEVVTTHLIPDPAITPEMRQDLVTRLPVRNREILA